jgi:hypothetical protein
MGRMSKPPKIFIIELRILGYIGNSYEINVYNTYTIEGLRLRSRRINA